MLLALSILSAVLHVWSPSPHSAEYVVATRLPLTRHSASNQVLAEEQQADIPEVLGWMEWKREFRVSYDSAVEEAHRHEVCTRARTFANARERAHARSRATCTRSIHASARGSLQS